jgi:hypothetical protein
MRVIAAIGQQAAPGVGRVEHHLQRLAVIEVGGRDLDAPVQPSGALPSLSASRSAVLACVIGAAPMLASTICPPRGM